MATPIRSRRLRRAGLVTLAALLALALVLGLLAVWAVRRPLPSHSGELELPGLSAPVTVYRDEYGIPQIYAETALDLFRAQGYVHAQDRFWEMDFRRHVTSGRLSELFGEGQLETDVFLRTLGWRRVAEAEWELLTPQTREYLTAYAEGVDAWVAATGGPAATGRKSLHYRVLGLQNPGYRVAPWDPVDSLAWLKAMAWDLRGNMQSEIERAGLYAAGLTPAQVGQLFPTYPYDRQRPIVPGGAVIDGGFDPGADPAGDPAPEPPPADRRSAGAAGDSGAAGDDGDGTDAGGGGGLADSSGPAGPDESAAAGARAGTAGLNPGESAAAAELLTALGRVTDRLPALLGTGTGLGSNSWVVSGEHTSTGAPLLVNDPHLGASLPGIWYQIGLHCDCDYRVSGFSFAGVPGVVIGHNARIAWGFTNLGTDVTDLYLERLDGDRYEVEGELRQLTTREETIRVAGGEDVTITVRQTHHGPLLSDADDHLRELAATPPPTDPPGAPPADPADPADPAAGAAGQAGQYGLSLAWTALRPGTTIEALFVLNQASDWQEFREAARLFEVPAQNLLYADVAGNIGYQAPGMVPVRGVGDGRWVAPGWDPRYDWAADPVPFDELPQLRNPDSGYLVTANQAVIGPQYQRLLTTDWGHGYRSERIHELLGQAVAAGPVDAEQMRQLLFDNHHNFAPVLVPALLRVPTAPLSRPEQQALQLLRDWDFQQPAGGQPGSAEAASSAAASYFNEVWRQLLALTFDELPGDYQPGGGGRWFTVVSQLLAEPESPWWDRVETAPVETRDDILARALSAAYQQMAIVQGDDPAQWRWGEVHTLRLRDASFGNSGIAPVEAVFNRGPVATAGGTDVVNANGWHAADGYQVTVVPSMRMIVDLADFDASQWVQLTGNSGHPYHRNYLDQLEPWRTGALLPWRWQRPSVAAAAVDTLTLLPG